mgnify:CR=1 FL=1
MIETDNEGMEVAKGVGSNHKVPENIGQALYGPEKKSGQHRQLLKSGILLVESVGRKSQKRNLEK